MLKLEFVELHSAVFIAGTNLGPKLNPVQRTGLVLEFCREHKELHVTWNGKTAIIPRENVACMLEAKKSTTSKKSQAIQEPEVIVPQGPIKAQYDTPMAHVFAGPGAGKN